FGPAIQAGTTPCRAQDWADCACWALATAAAYARARRLLRRAAVLGWRTRRAPALSILAVACLKAAAAFSRSFSAADSSVRFVKVLMTFLVIRLCMRRFWLCRMRLLAEGEFGMGPWS